MGMAVTWVSPRVAVGIEFPYPFPQDLCEDTHRNLHVGIPIGLKSFLSPSHMGIQT